MWFTRDLLRTHSEKIERGAALLACGDALAQYLEVTRKAPPRMRPAELQQLMHCTCRFLNIREDAGLPFVPKMHMMLHLAHQAGRFGKPLCTRAWVDGGLNRKLAEVCGAAHKHVFEKGVVATFNSEHGPTARAVERKRGRA